jgi:flagellin
VSFRINTNISAMNALNNLGRTSTETMKSVNRLSTGLRINDASDDPAGLIFSESFRAQISGVTQAMRNNQDALNYTKVADGALDEVGRLLREARTLAVASGNTGTQTQSQLQANQNQLNLILDSIDRIAQNTQFGDKRILDGSAGVQSIVVKSTAISSMSFGGTVGGQAITADGAIGVNVTTAATRASHSGTRSVAAANLAAYQAAAVGGAHQFSINGTQFTVGATETWGQVVQRINEQSGATGVTAEANFGGGNGNIVLRSTGYGSNAKVSLVDATGIIQSASGTASATGTNAVATVTVGSLSGVTFTGGQNGDDGLTLSDSAGNKIKLAEGGNTVTNHTAAGQIVAGLAQFQIGANAGQFTTLSLGKFTSSSLGLSGVKVTSATDSTDTISKLDSAIESLNKRRGEIGSFMRNVLETNIRTLGIAKENLSATESSVRDIDVAEEMTQYTKLQILTQSGMSVLAQANQAPNQVLSLLRG